MQKSCLPEGCIMSDGELKEYVNSVPALEYARDNGIVLEANVTLCDSGHNLHVDLGKYTGIIPKSETVYNPSGEAVKDIAIITRVGKRAAFVVTDVAETENGVRVLLSRKLAQKKCCDEYISKLECGDVIQTRVTHLEKFGVFCDIGCGMTALLPVDCISVSRISHPAERFEVGQLVKCVVKNIERDTMRVTLTHKELLGTWLENAKGFLAGETVTGIVRSVEQYGIFVELSPNLAGLAEWCEDVREGDVAAVYIKSIIPEKMKIKLVIVGICHDKAPKVQREYFFDEDHMDEWCYSPKGCVKEVYTIF